MAFRRESYIRYRSFMEACENLSPKDYKIISIAMDKLALDGEEPENLTGHVKALFSVIRPQIIANTNRYLNGIKGKEGGKEGGAPIGNQNARKYFNGVEQNNPKTTPKGLIKTTPNENVNDNETDNVTETDNETENVRKESIKEKNESNDSYTRVEVIEDVGWEKFKDWLDRNTPSVTRMQQPFTREQYHAIKDKYSNREIIDLLQAMENYKPLTQKNKSAYLTFINWMNKRKENGNSTTKNTDTKRQELDDYARELACKLVGR